MSRPLLMCRSCGHFVPAAETDGTLRSLLSDCPKCGASEFKDVRDD